VAITSDLPKERGVAGRQLGVALLQLRQSRGYDIAMRLPLLLWCGFLAISAANDLMGYTKSL
jgi:hypothetical protein